MAYRIRLLRSRRGATCRRMSQVQGYGSDAPAGNPDIVFPFGGHPQALRAHLIKSLTNTVDAKIAFPIRANCMWRLAIRCLPEDLGKSDGSSLTIEHDSIQRACARSGVCQARDHQQSQ